MGDPENAILQKSDASRIREALENGGVYVEFCPEAPPDWRERAARTTEGGMGLYLLLTTKSVELIEPAQLFLDALASRLALGKERRWMIETALHEALANAAIHGNLEMESNKRRWLRSYSGYVEEMEKKLSDPVFSLRWIEVAARWCDMSINLFITHNGKGFDPEKARAAASKKGRNGLGLGLMDAFCESLAFGNQGRSLAMRFDR